MEPTITCEGQDKFMEFDEAIIQRSTSKEHYQKIDKYKQKYRGNIFIGKLPTDLTDGNIPSVFIEGITVGKKIKTLQKKNDNVSFLPTE